MDALCGLLKAHGAAPPEAEPASIEVRLHFISNATWMHCVGLLKEMDGGEATLSGMSVRYTCTIMQ